MAGEMGPAWGPSTQGGIAVSNNFDYDYIIIGSGFGGAVSALRLSEKGYTVGVLEMGKRFGPDDYPKTNLNLRKYLWIPKLFMHGFFQISWMKDVVVYHGAGVGGGSLVYANTLLVPPAKAFEDPRWPSDEDWEQKMEPYYDLAKFMLGVVEAQDTYAADEILRQVVDEDMGAGNTFRKHTVGVYYGEPGTEVDDPFFGGEGPSRTGCITCGECMSGCRHNAKNTLDKNYLYLAEKRGCVIHPETKVVDIRPLAEGGYEIHTENSLAFFNKQPRVFRCKGVVVSASVLGTVKLLMDCRDRGSLPNISNQLGDYVRTNSEAILAVTARDGDGPDMSRGIAITSGVHPNDHTHIEMVRYGKGHNFTSLLTTIMTGAGPPWPRWLRWLGNIVRHPVDFLRTCRLSGWAERSAIVLVMQPLDNYMRLRKKGNGLTTELAEGQTVPTYMPLANDITQRIADKINGTPQSMFMEVVGNTSSTAHILGGATMGRTAAEGVCDELGRVFGYDNMYIADGSIVPANLGVNPSLTITALSEYVMANVPANEGAEQKPAPRPATAAIAV